MGPQAGLSDRQSCSEVLKALLGHMTYFNLKNNKAVNTECFPFDAFNARVVLKEDLK